MTLNSQMGSTVHRRPCPKDRERVKFHPGFFVMLILIYAFIVLVLFDCQVDLMLIMYSAASL